MDNLTKHTCSSPLNWHNCYNKDSRYAKYFTPESNAHPAKMSWGLAERIFKHLKQLNLLKPNSTIIDFMAGTGRTNIMATLHGHKSIAIELEPHFCKMITDNKSQLEKVKMTDCDIEIIQADARNMSEILTEGGVGVVSPPYQDAMSGKPKDPKKQYERFKSHPIMKDFLTNGRFKNHLLFGTEYSPNPDNIGNLPDKPLVGVVSPPYQHSKTHPSIGSARRADWNAGGGDIVKRRNLEDQAHYSKNPDNIGNLPDKPLVGVVSPPYGNRLSDGGTRSPETNEKVKERFRGFGGQSQFEKYSYNKDNIGNLPDKPLVGITSPPYANPRSDPGTLGEDDYEQKRELDKDYGRGSFRGRYGEEDGQIGNQQDDSYLSAMLQVYSQAYKSGISPLVVVTKNPTRNGELRRLDLDTVNLLHLAGYKIIDYHRAILFKERNQMTLDGDMKKIAKGRLSFFKRLSYDKGGKVARWEDVIFAQKEEFIWKQ